MRARYDRIDSPSMGRAMHVWAFGHFGVPVLAFPSAAGFAHEWKQQGMVEALAPLIEGGKIKLYCPESNVSEAWTRRDLPPHEKIRRHQAYERFVLETMVPLIRADCHLPEARVAVTGCSLGAMYAANLALKHPETFWWALCMSGRYEVRHFLDGFSNLDVYFDNPLAYVPNLGGPALDRARRTSLTLVCGQGRWEDGCIEETIALASLLHDKGIPCERDLWGHDVSHEWPWWRRQVVHHLGRRFA